MIITLPHTKILSKVVSPLKELDLEQYIMFNSDSYSSMMQSMWDRRESFINVEHDVVTTKKKLLEMWECEHDWCAYSYDDKPFSGCIYFACTKFSRGLMEKIPRVWEEMQDRRWEVIDCYFTDYTKKHNLEVHQHFPLVEHLK